MSLTPALTPRLLDVLGSRHTALDYVTEAFAEAVLDGIEADAFAEAAIATALGELVAAHGEERIAESFADLAERIRVGEFSSRVRQ